MSLALISLSYLLKMHFTGKEKAFCVLEFDKNNSWTRVQRNFWEEFSKQPPDRRPIQNGMRNLSSSDVCAPQKELPHHLQLKRSKESVACSRGTPESESEELIESFRCP